MHYPVEGDWPLHDDFEYPACWVRVAKQMRYAAKNQSDEHAVDGLHAVMLAFPSLIESYNETLMDAARMCQHAMMAVGWAIMAIEGHKDVGEVTPQEIETVLLAAADDLEKSISIGMTFRSMAVSMAKGAIEAFIQDMASKGVESLSDLADAMKAMIEDSDDPADTVVVKNDDDDESTDPDIDLSFLDGIAGF